MRRRKRDGPDKPAAVAGTNVDVHGRGVPPADRDRRRGVECALHGRTDAPRKPQGHLFLLVLVLLGKCLIREADLVEDVPHIRPGECDFDRAEHLLQRGRMRVALVEDIRKIQLRAELFGRLAALVQRPFGERGGPQGTKALAALRGDGAEMAQERQGGLRLVQHMLGRDRLAATGLAHVCGIRTIGEEACRAGNQP